MEKIIVFTIPGCLACAMLKSSLNNESIPFTEIDITINQDIWDSVKKQGGTNITPTVFVQTDKDGSGDLYIMKENFNDTLQMVEIIKDKYLNK